MANENTEAVDPKTMTDFEISTWAANFFEKKEDLLFPLLALPERLAELKYRTDGKAWFSPGGFWIFADKDWSCRNMVADPIMTQVCFLEIVRRQDVRVMHRNLANEPATIAISIRSEGIDWGIASQTPRWGRTVIEALHAVVTETA